MSSLFSLICHDLFTDSLNPEGCYEEARGDGRHREDCRGRRGDHGLLQSLNLTISHLTCRSTSAPPTRWRWTVLGRRSGGSTDRCDVTVSQDLLISQSVSQFFYSRQLHFFMAFYLFSKIFVSLMFTRWFVQFHTFDSLMQLTITYFNGNVLLKSCKEIFSVLWKLITISRLSPSTTPSQQRVRWEPTPTLRK